VVYSRDIAGVGMAHDITQKPALIFPGRISKLKLSPDKLSDPPETPSKSHYGIY